MVVGALLLIFAFAVQPAGADAFSRLPFLRLSLCLGLGSWVTAAVGSHKSIVLAPATLCYDGGSFLNTIGLVFLLRNVVMDDVKQLLQSSLFTRWFEV